VLDRRGEVLIGHDLLANPTRRSQLLTRTLRSPLEEFEKRLQRHLPGLASLDAAGPAPLVQFGDAQCLPLPDESVDLIVTSPPYASNAIDYMRAHKFSLVWLGHSIDDLSRRRGEYIGGESINGTRFETLPARTDGIVAAVAGRDGQRGQAVRRYYSEMTRVLREMRRVLKPGKAAILVAGTSII
jgi:adenine-specific DNA methylase